MDTSALVIFERVVEDGIILGIRRTYHNTMTSTRPDVIETDVIVCYFMIGSIKQNAIASISNIVEYYSVLIAGSSEFSSRRGMSTIYKNPVTNSGSIYDIVLNWNLSACFQPNRVVIDISHVVMSDIYVGHIDSNPTIIAVTD